MLGEPYHMPIPKVFGVKFTGTLREGVTPTDLVLTVTERLREKNVVGAFVEYFGEGYGQLSVPDRATIGNMSPEYGATSGFFPVDEATLAYLVGTARPKAHIEMVSRYARQFGFFVSDLEPRYSEVIQIELDKIEPSIAGPRNPEERHALVSVPSFTKAMLAERRSASHVTSSASRSALMLEEDGPIHAGLGDGSVVIAAITSCTNTSNPTVMVGAGLIAKRAVEAGLAVKPWVKPSLAPGSTVVTDYLQNSGLLPYLDRLGFVLVGYGCTTCIGNSGPLAPEVEKQIKDRDLYAVAVLSGNRNFDGRIHPLAKGSFLMSPMLVVAYALAGKIDFDFASTPLGKAADGRPVFLKDLWPSLAEVKKTVESSLSSELYAKRYAAALKGDERWEKLTSSSGEVYTWQRESTYIQHPPWFDASMSTSSMKDVRAARVLAVFEDKVTTDHISPAGTIAVGSPAELYLKGRGVGLLQLSTYGSRRGNHEVMVRGGFSNIRLKNLLSKKEGGYTTHFQDGAQMTIYDAAMEYIKEKVPLVILAGKQYGAGSSRDWAAKAPRLQGVRAVIAESFERIHRSNLVAMGIIPLQFKPGEGVRQLGLTGEETVEITGIEGMSSPRQWVDVVARGASGEKRFKALVRVDNSTEMQYVQSGGVLPYVFGRLSKSVH